MSAPLGTQPFPMVTCSGRDVWFREPHHTQVDLDADVFPVLARICRYGGHYEVSVLRHLALCVELVRVWERDDRVALAAWVAAHDLHEAYVGDVSAALKPLLGPAWRDIEDAWEAWVHRSLGFAWPRRADVTHDVKHIDHVAAVLEMSALGHPSAESAAMRWNVYVARLEASVWLRVAKMSDAGLADVVRGAIVAGGYVTRGPAR